MGRGKLTDPETLVLPADKDGRDEVPANKEQEENVMHLRMPIGIKNRQADQAHGAHEGKHNGQGDEHLLADGAIRDQAAAVPQPALGGKGQVEGDGGDAGAGDEERLHLEGANVADVGERHVGLEGRVAALVGADGPLEEHAEEHAEPDEAGEDGEPLVVMVSCLPVVVVFWRRVVVWWRSVGLGWRLDGLPNTI